MPRPTTPVRSSRQEIRTPDAPKHGPMYDNYEPYAPRKSSRLTARQAAAPAVPSISAALGTTNATTGSVQSSAMGMVDLTSTPARTRARTMQIGTPATGSMGRMVDFATPPSTMRATRSRDLFNNGSGGLSKDDTSMGGMASGSRALMLPTPAKTPSTASKTTIEASAINSVARTLFPSQRSSIDDAMPNRRRKARAKLDSEINGEEEPLIKIFTDSKERIPEVEEDNNPFYRSKAVIAPIPGKLLKTKSPKRRKVVNPEFQVPAGWAPEDANGPGFVFVK